MSKDFFLKKKETSIDLDKFKDYDLKNELDTEACGLTSQSESTFSKRSDDFYKNLEFLFSRRDDDRNPVAKVCKDLEKNFSSREISFLLSKSILINLMEQNKTNK